MLDTLFQGMFDTQTVSVISPGDFLLCMGSALIMGLVLSAAHSYHNKSTKAFGVTLSLLPAVVCVIIMMVNGNVGTGVAVAGAFSLVRFRSAPGTSREIGSLFIAMGAGMIAGMGYLGYAFLFTGVVAGVSMALSRCSFGTGGQTGEKTLRITIPEDLDYTDVFTPIFEENARSWELTSVRTTNMGSLYKLTYDLTLQGDDQEKALIDALRQRNGNLEISISRQETPAMGL